MGTELVSTVKLHDCVDGHHEQESQIIGWAADDDEATVTLLKRLPALKGVLDFLMQEGSLREVHTQSLTGVPYI